jgi:polyvinyl alcohol dehydrogenase (cytochrome)
MQTRFPNARRLAVRRAAHLVATLLFPAWLAACSDVNSGGGPVPPSDPGEWRNLGGSLDRLYFNPAETTITKENASRLVTKWRFLTGAIVTAQPIVANVDLPGEGRTKLVFVPSWDGRLYALRFADGSLAWSFAFKPQPGASYPQAGSATVEDVGGRRLVFVGAGMTVYCLDAATGAKVWEFDAGTGCTTCQSTEERNQVESSPAVFGGLVYFGMDVNDTGGKGGFYAVDARTGAMRFFFDLASGQSCRPFPDDDVRRFDGYHSAEALGLPPDFFATRPGCDFERRPNGCGNVWSSASIDARRGLLYTASSNCDTDLDPNTDVPPPPMPPFDEAVFALRLGTGEPAWVWRPREVDPEDLSFGAVPNLFSTSIGGVEREVVGIGNKDGHYYLLDRDGTNEITGRVEPYWAKRVVPGGAIGGILASAAVGDGRIYVSTAIGTDITDPQKPAASALDPSTGEFVWANMEAEPSYSSASGIPGVVFMGSLSGSVYAYDGDTGTQLASLPAGSTLGSAATVVDGTVLFGAGTGERGGNPLRIEYTVSLLPSTVNAYCVAGTEGCPANESCDDGDACTVDEPSASGCSRRPAADGTACTVGALSGSCLSGRCDLEGLACEQVSDCTTGVPDVDRCRYEAKPDGIPCRRLGGGTGRCSAGACIRG